jgi:hypothetical protein
VEVGGAHKSAKSENANKVKWGGGWEEGDEKAAARKPPLDWVDHGRVAAVPGAPPPPPFLNCYTHVTAAGAWVEHLSLNSTTCSPLPGLIRAPTAPAKGQDDKDWSIDGEHDHQDGVTSSHQISSCVVSSSSSLQS